MLMKNIKITLKLSSEKKFRGIIPIVVFYIYFKYSFLFYFARVIFYIIILL